MPTSLPPRRVYCREWKLQARSVRGSVSLPRLHLITSTRPFFECPVCFLSNDRVPLCLWCKSTTPQSAAAFWASMPKQRTISAPMKISWSYVPVKAAAGLPGRTKSAEAVARPRSRATQGTPSMRSMRSMRSISSHNSSLVDKTNTFGSSPRTSTTTTAETKPQPSCPSVDKINRPLTDPNQPEEGKFHTLPLRRKGHILRTTAGIVVNKSRLSALFRKDAVPVLDKVNPVAENPPPKAKRKDKSRTKISTETKHAEPRQQRQKRCTLPTLSTLPTIPDASIPAATVTAASTYTTPTPPSFLSPFWYRPEEYDRLPASPPSSRPTSVKVPGHKSLRPTHTHTLSEPFPTLERTPSTCETHPKKWKRRMSGFFRHSISVVAGHKAIH